jgi:multiple sugar transport system substrate-binding protein
MNAGWAWSITSIASAAAESKVKSWDIAVMPSWNGTTTSPLDADTFTILKTSKNPDAAFKAMESIMADPSLMKNYGGEPARTADQAAYFASFDKTLAPIFPGNHVTWSVLIEMATVPAIPSHEADMPNATKANADIMTFLTRLKNTAGLNLDTELAKLQQTLQKDFDSAAVQ